MHHPLQQNRIISLLLLTALLLLLPAAARAQDEQMRVLGEDQIQDSSGRKIQVEEPFQRIVSLYGAHTENLFSLGLDQEIKGVGLHESYPPEAQEKKSLSYQQGPEKILSVKPDLVLIRPMIDQGYSKLIQTLERSGVTVVSLQPGNVEEMFTYWQILGVLTGKKGEAQKMQESFQAAVDYAGELTKGLQEKKQVFFEAMHGQLKTFAPDSMPIFALEAAGGKNAAPDAKPVRGTNIAEMGKERLISQAEDIEVYLSQQGPMNQPSKEEIRNEPGLHLIEAIKQEEIYIIDEELVSRPTLRLVQGIAVIGGHLYPELFTEEVKERMWDLAQDR
ncbi:MAG: ABC transporter substrate-binding protein [Desulfohalobiaceae bacterium]